MTVHGTMPNMYKVEGYGIDEFTTDHIEVGKTYRLMSDEGNMLERQVMGISDPHMQLFRVKEQDTIHVTIDAFVKVMRGRGIKG
ncbi:hypothetical protein D3C74_218870 [compost metagenome]